MRASDLTEDQWRMVREEVAKAHEHCPCVEKLTARVIELEQAQEEHIQTHRREAMLGLPTYDRRSD